MRDELVGVRRSGPLVGLSAVAFAGYLLLKELRGQSLAGISDAFEAIPPARWALAALSTAVAYGALAWYDQIALLHLRRRLGWRFVGAVSFVAYALGAQYRRLGGVGRLRALPRLFVKRACRRPRSASSSPSRRSPSRSARC